MLQKVGLKYALALDILRHEQMVAIIDNVAEMTNPVAEDNHAGLSCQL